MKRKLNKVLIGLITLTMIISSTGLAFAGESQAGIESKAVNAEQSATDESNGNISQEKSAAEPAAKAISPKGISAKGGAIEYLPEKATAVYNSETNIYTWYLDVAPGEHAVFPVTAQTSGLMYVDAYATSNNASESYYVYTYNNYNDAYYNTGNNRYEYLYLKSGDFADATRYMPVTKGKEYYIVIENKYYNASTVRMKVAPYIYSSLTQRTLSQGTTKWTLASGKNISGNTSTTYFKVKPNKTGVMTLSLSEDGRNGAYAKVTLLNSKKQAVSETITYNSKSLFFGLKKNYTYYVKVSQCTGAYPCYLYGIKYNMTSRIDRDLGTKSKAKKLTRGADSTDTLFVASTSTSSDWYKFYVSSKRKTVVRVDATGIKSGYLAVRVYCGSKYIGKTNVPATYYKDISITNSTTYGKANKGTYYVKVTKSSKASGKYRIRYKQ